MSGRRRDAGGRILPAALVVPFAGVMVGLSLGGRGAGAWRR